MKILHCCLSCFYIDEYNYQENILPKIHSKNGNDVKIIASTETFVDNKRLGYVKPSTYNSKEGIEITRIPYKKYLPHFLMKKIRHYDNVKKFLNDFKPDIILFHGVPAYELYTICEYKRNNPKVKLYVDSHEDDNNSANNFLSKQILHKIFYRNIIKKNIKYIDKILYITSETKDFLIKYYKIPEKLLEFYPLGGTIIDEEIKDKFRIEKRNELGLSNQNIVFCHSGKMNENKKTYELIVNFSKVKDERFRLIIIGVFTEEVKSKIIPLINDEDGRIMYLGWKNSDELIKYIASSDLYVQPGSQSATLQNAICAGTPVLFEDVKSYEVYKRGNAFAINHYYEMESIFRSISENPRILEEMSGQAYKLARKILDYEKLARRILE